MLEELKKAFRSRPFWVSFCTCFVVLLGYSLVYWLGSIKAGEWIEYRESALHLALGGIYFGGFMLLFPFCVAFSYATGQVDEMRSGMMQWRTFRSSIWKYVKLKVGAGMIVSACAAVVPFILHAILWYHIALPIEPEVYPNHAIYFSERFIYHDVYALWHGLPLYAGTAIGMAFTAAMWSVIALAVSIWIPDKLLVIAIPAAIYYIWNADISFYVFDVPLPSPTSLFNDGLSVQKAVTALIMYAIAFAISVGSFYMGCRKRCQDV